jgi:hypothetical protein
MARVQQFLANRSFVIRLAFQERGIGVVSVQFSSVEDVSAVIFIIWRTKTKARRPTWMIWKLLGMDTANCALCLGNEDAQRILLN